MSLNRSPASNSRSDEYDRFAAIYNRWMGEDFCRRMLPVVDRLLLSSLPMHSHVLDLCCGSGQMARALTERGFRVTGVDASEEMLSFARQNAPFADFRCADARNFVAPEPFHAALSTFNSLAHFGTVADLIAVFANVRRALRPGSRFLFDISMEEAYTTKWHSSFALLGDDHACIVQPTYDGSERIGTNHITIFTLDNRFTLETRNAKLETGSCYRRSDFAIVQKCHSESDLRTALRQSGFSEIRAFDGERDLAVTGENGRMFFLCS